MGVHVEDTALKADKFNEKGYWEQKEVVDINDRILAHMGGSWKLPPRMMSGWEDLNVFGYFYDEAKRIVLKLSKNKIWALKNPRLCLTLPFWLRLVPRRHYCILCIRNPLAVAESILRRDKLSIRFSGIFGIFIRRMHSRTRSTSHGV